ncbi:helix-turn-helix domain-containing protein [Pedobacter rhodius]|uniref:Helix-turn-helix domain-containing protein n=1 Tax=Pedobacter rhodius TaxID=3004098 RepID=A0ABT4KVJ9_9SPHI|nr:helix-turn-helix domain-containing protein [Pedobacter sp. SJ11]MCZ4222942.1 helix-turn-helix domain-containing protein [Pedobacter sp. SJ11]
MQKRQSGKNLRLSCTKNEPIDDADLIVRMFNTAVHNDDRPEMPFRSTAYAVLLITKGSLKLKINFIEHTFNARDILFVFPGFIYDVAADANATVISTHFNKDYLSRKGIFLNTAESYHLFDKQKSIKFSLSKSEYDQLHYGMVALYRKLDIGKEIRHINDIIHNSFLGVLYDLYLLNEKRQKTPQLLVDSRVELTDRFLSLVSERFKKEKRVTYYANCLRITPRHLSQVVKQITNKTAGEHIVEFVIREAKLLLTSHVMNISEIAQELCFSNSSFFGKYFKKHTGFSPLSFKQWNTIAI